MVNEEIRSLTAQGLDSCGIRLQAQQLELLFAYIAEIELWNPTYKLVSADRRDLIFRHIIDSLAPLHILTEVIDSFPDRGAVRAADVGSGNGMPGIPLAVALEDLEITLIERSGRRAGFLRNALAVTGLASRTTLIEKDLAEVRQTFDLLIFRAFRPLPDIFDELDRLLSPGGVMFAYKSRKGLVDQEIDRIGAERLSGYEISQLPYESCFGETDRRICLLRKRS